MTRLKPYPTYQDSRLPWLERLPTDWSTLRSKNVFNVVDVRSETGEEEILTVSASDGVVPRSQKKVTMFKAESYVGHKLCWPGDLVINSLWAWMQGLGFSRHHGLVSSAYGVYRPKPPFTSQWRFFDYLLRSAAYKWELQTRSKGVWLSRLQLSDPAFLDMPIVVPPADDAAAIARFLDYIDRRTRRYIRAQRKLIALLEEQKQAIILRAVTLGLDPSVYLKPSGVEWLGEMPGHWEITPVRRLIAFITSGSRGWAKFYSDDGDLFVQSGNLGRSMALDLAKVHRVRVPPGAEGQRTRIAKNDILVCVTGALTGNVAFVNGDLPPAYVNQHVALVRPDPGLILPRFLAYALYSPFAQAQFKLTEYGGTKQGLGLDDVRNVVVLVPSVEEQQQIVAQLDAQTTCFSELINGVKHQIDLVREYRTRLIADVVTGKLDVRRAASNLPEEAEEPDDWDADEAEEESDEDMDEADVEANDEGD